MAAIEIGEAALKQLEALAEHFRLDGAAEAVEHLAGVFHNAHIEAGLPDGYALRDDLMLDDIERYFNAYMAEKPTSNWGEYGRALRAAIGAGWFSQPEGISPKTIPPPLAPRLWRAVDAHYVRLTTADPNS